MFHTTDEFLQEWNREAEATERILKQLTDASLSQRVTQDHFSLGELGWHLSTTIPVFAEPLGLQVPSPGDPKSVPTCAANITAAYTTTNQTFIKSIKATLKDDDYKERKNIFGMNMPLGAALRILVSHQIHHRGQMTVLMRQAGLQVPGVYGPSREEYAEMMRGETLDGAQQQSREQPNASNGSQQPEQQGTLQSMNTVQAQQGQQQPQLEAQQNIRQASVNAPQGEAIPQVNMNNMEQQADQPLQAQQGQPACQPEQVQGHAQDQSQAQVTNACSVQEQAPDQQLHAQSVQEQAPGQQLHAPSMLPDLQQSQAAQEQEQCGGQPNPQQGNASPNRQQLQ